MYFICAYYVCIYVYICMYYLLQCELIHTYMYLHIHLILIGDSLDYIFYFEVLYRCIVINISLFIYEHRSSCNNVMKYIYLVQYSIYIGVVWFFDWWTAKKFCSLCMYAKGLFSVAFSTSFQVNAWCLEDIFS